MGYVKVEELMQSGKYGIEYDRIYSTYRVVRFEFGFGGIYTVEKIGYITADLYTKMFKSAVRVWHCFGGCYIIPDRYNLKRYADLVKYGFTGLIRKEFIEQN